jgi:serine/threonine protein kinase/tetratricopeptide (TPR) repeat protein
MIGQTISHYRIIEKLGQGGMGVVYKAEDVQLGRTVALKFLPRHVLGDPNERARFLQEARAAAVLHHPNICTIHEIDSVDDQTFIAMTCVEGENLHDRIAKGPLPLVDAVTFALQLSNALHEAHSKGVVHRDLKPSNVIISEAGHAILMDFGLAKLRGVTRITQAGTTLGTVGYMSPEQAQGKDVDHRSDIWSLGVILFEMITGRQPFSGDNQSAVIFAIGQSPVPPLTSLRSDVPMELERIVGKMLAKDREERYQTIDDVRVDLKAVRKGLRGESQSNHSVADKDDSLRRRILGTTPSGTVIIRQKWPAWATPVLAIGAILIVAAAFLLLRDGGTSQQQGAQRAGAPDRALENSLAVLPLKNLSGDEKNEFFVDGMTEELITQLASLRALKVISRTSIMRYKDSDKPLTEIASDLGVGRILEGSVLWAGERVRISVQLIDGTNDAHLWANSYESDLNDVLGLQRRVATEVAGEIKLELTPQEKAQLAQSPVVDSKAHELYLQGRHHWNRRSVESLNKSVEYFQKALEIDPNYAMAYAGLAETYVVLPSWDFNRRTSETYPKAKEFALKALDIDPLLAAPHAVLGGVAGEYEWNFDEAERQFLRAIELNPNYATAHQWYAELLIVLARYDEAVRQVDIALELDPLARIIYAASIWAHSAAGDRQEVADLFAKVRELDPGWAGAFAAMFNASVLLGDQRTGDESWTTFAEMSAVTAQEREDAKRLRTTLERGTEAFTRELLRQRQRQRRETYVVPALIATDFAVLGEVDSAIVWLEKGFDERSNLMPQAATDPRFDRLRSDRRFQEIVRRMSLEDAQERYLRRRDGRSS